MIPTCCGDASGDTRRQDLPLSIETEIDDGIGPALKSYAADERHAVVATESERRDDTPILESHLRLHASHLALKHNLALANIRLRTAV